MKWTKVPTRWRSREKTAASLQRWAPLCLRMHSDVSSNTAPPTAKPPRQHRAPRRRHRRPKQVKGGRDEAHDQERVSGSAEISASHSPPRIARAGQGCVCPGRALRLLMQDFSFFHNSHYPQHSSNCKAPASNCSHFHPLCQSCCQLLRLWRGGRRTSLVSHDEKFRLPSPPFARSLARRRRWPPVAMPVYIMLTSPLPRHS